MRRLVKSLHIYTHILLVLFTIQEPTFNPKENYVIERLRGCSAPCLEAKTTENSPPPGHAPYPRSRVVGGFPGGAVVKHPPANAEDMGSSPGPGRSHMPWSSWVREPQLLSLRIWSLCSETREATIVRGPHTAMQSGPHLPQLEKALTQKRRPKHSHK